MTSFLQWHDDPAHLIALIVLAFTGYSAGRWITRPRTPRTPTLAIPPINTYTHSPTTTGGACDCDNCHRVHDQHTNRADAIQADIDQTMRIITKLTTSIETTRADTATLRALYEQLKDAKATHHRLATELGYH